MALHDRFLAAAERFPDRTAVCEPDGASLSYAELETLSARLRAHLVAAGVEPGDRVGICLHKSIDSVASIFGILSVGAAYVPVDPTAPASRNGYIFADCQVKLLITEEAMVEALRAEMAELGHTTQFLALDGVGGGAPLAAGIRSGHPAVEVRQPGAKDLAYILYTSGSTGRPKGVMIAHENAECFVDWCSDVFEPTEEDRFSSHAPFHFDLSILDIYTPLKHGATLYLVSESLGKDPTALAKYIADSRLTVWYSTPSILSLLVDYGEIEEQDCRSLRHVLFAGEVFPIPALRALRDRWPHPRYFNLYGPTETNVCTWYELPRDIDPDRTEPYPIGVVCAHYRGRIVDPDGLDVGPGEEGELWIAGPGVMQGYWNLDEQTAACFVEDDGRWYRTGDLVQEAPDENLIFRGRKDRMVKKRGYRVELGEIEACLHGHPNVREAAVIALASDGAGLIVRAHLSTRDGEKISMIQLKKFCSERLPVYMVPDQFRFHADLPQTSTDKMDYQALKRMD